MVAIRKSLPQVMSLPLAKEILGADLGRASKMPGRSWGISAYDCRRGAELAQVEGTVCSKCYAKRGNYGTSTVQDCQKRRLAAVDHPRWVDAFVYLLRCYDERYFRWFDSGDLQSPEHLAKIVAICRRTPRCSHWIPTHEPGIVREFLAGGGKLPGNLVIRISADYIEDRPTDVPAGCNTSTVHKFKGEPVPAATGNPKHSIECKAYERGHHCGPCRACWSPDVANVSYPKH